MSTSAKFRRFSLITLLLSVPCVTLVFIYFPPTLTTRWIVAVGTLLLLAVLSSYLALTVTEGGASTAVD
ncbi:MAG: hypothetical protein MJB57_09985, partial [Gemmatimonadetes bacterium]|nr:hypothetical protein [Gemmatimonadota bacterium]